MSQLTAARVNEVLNYDRETGVCTWRVATGRRAKTGAIAGSLRPDGYIEIGIDAKRYLIHRVIYLRETGEWPPAEIDHVDLDRSNNRWTNLRPADSFQNKANKPRHKNNKCGFKGVWWHNFKSGRGSWYAMIRIDGKGYYLGSFATAEEAHAAYLAAAVKEFGDFHRAA
jgi:HNH endonuclease/AP2 domain